MEILHLDDAIIVVNKPAGLAVLSGGWEPGAPFLVRMLEEQYAGPGGRIWVVHRLDKNTSGAMVFARTPEAHRDLSLQFERREAQKTYHAILVGSVSWEERAANQPLRVDVGHRHRTAVDARGGKPAETEFRVLKRFRSGTLVEAKPKTGRTHQIRAHARLLGNPILGDQRYDAPSSDFIDRPALHAYTLTIRNPLTGKVETFTAPYPPDFSNALELLGREAAQKLR